MLKQYLDRFAAMEKKANETLSAEPAALVGVDSLPGSEHDQKVPEDAKKPDAEVQQGQPAGATSTEGAVNGGDAKPLNEGKLEVDQPLENPDQKPMTTDDALTAKEANAHLVSLVSDLLKDLNPAQKQASCGGEGATHAAAPAAKSAPAAKKEEKAEVAKGEEKKASKQTITLDDITISKIAEAQAMFMAGREAAGKSVKQAAASEVSANARKLIKEACVKAAQEQGLDPAAAEAAAEGAMSAAGIPAESAVPAEMAAADAATADAAAAEAAAADAGAAEAGAAEAGIPEDVTEEELATAIVDLVSSGDLDPDTAKALVEEIAGDEGAAAPTEDQAAEIIAQGLESGEITPEQAQQIATAVEGGAEGAAAEGAADAAAADAEAQGAADAAAAAQDAQDEAKGEADAETALKEAAAAIRSNALSKIASHIVSKRNEKAAAAAPQPGSRVMAKVASILKAKVEAKKQAEANTDISPYEAGFRKKAEEMGVDPVALARYMLARQGKDAK